MRHYRIGDPKKNNTTPTPVLLKFDKYCECDVHLHCAKYVTTLGTTGNCVTIKHNFGEIAKMILNFK